MAIDTSLAGARTLATALASNRRLLDKFLFTIYAEPLLADVGFTTMSELRSSTEIVEYRAGGSLIPEKSPGLSSFENVTLTRGATSNIISLYDWYQSVTEASARGGPIEGRWRGSGSAPDWCCGEYRYDVIVAQTDRCHNGRKWWRLVNAWPSELSVVDGLDNNASERVIESLTLTFDYFELLSADGSVLGSFSEALVQRLQSEGVEV